MYDDTGDNTARTVDFYRSEVGRYPLLSAEEEIDLATAYKRGRAARRSLAHSLARGLDRRGVDGAGTPHAGALDVGARRDLEEAISRGERARKRLIECNLRLVIHLARHHASPDLPLEDLVQEGNIGLMEAVERFDPRRGVRFSTYAGWWIRGAMRRAWGAQGRAIRLPASICEALQQLRVATARLEAQWGRPPAAAELAAELDTSAHRIRQLQRWDCRTLSLEAPLGDEPDSRLADLIPDGDAPPLDETLAHRQLQQALRETMMTHLAPRELAFLRVRYGLDGSQGQTLKQAAYKLGLTQAHARQVEKRALKQLRHTGALNEFR